MFVDIPNNSWILKIYHMTEKYERTILLTDPTGTVGNSVLKQLASLGQDTLRVAVDRKNKVEKLKFAHEVLNIDYTKPEAIADALDNVDILFLRIPPSFDMVDISYNFVKEAKKTGIKFIVKLSAMDVNQGPGYTSGRSHREVEKIIEESGIPFAFLRPNSFMQNFLTRSGLTLKNQGEIYLPAGNAKISIVDARDVAAVATEVLTKNGGQHVNKIYDITGPEALSHSQVAEILSKETGRSISYVDISEEDLRNRMKKMGIAGWYIENALELYEMYRSGFRSQTTDVVEQLTEQTPTSFSQFVRNYVQSGLSWPNQTSMLTGWIKFE
jgi:uncharacterized protein YbjT (DUF2867 family)